MDPERRLELIAMLAGEHPDAWGAIILIGQELLDRYYPAKVFTGESGDSGPAYVMALREALARATDR